MKPSILKEEIVAALRARLEGQLEALLASQKSVQAGAIHEENRQEHPKDTRAIEAQYLARGLAERVETLRDAVTTMANLRLSVFGEDAAAAVSALVAVEFDDEESLYFLVPVGGGEKLEVAGELVQTLTPSSPLGQALAGRREDESVVVDLPGGRREALIVSVR